MHATGIAETIIDRVELASDVRGVPLEGDDSAWAAAAGSQAIQEGGRLKAPLRDGAALVWLRDSPFGRNGLTRFTFRVEDAGSPPPHAEYRALYGDARPRNLRPARSGAGVFRPRTQLTRPVRRRWRRSRSAGARSTGAATRRHRSAGTHMTMAPCPRRFRFRTAFQSRATIRIFVQIKRNGRVETGVFEARVSSQRSAVARQQARLAGNRDGAEVAKVERAIASAQPLGHRNHHRIDQTQAKRSITSVNPVSCPENGRRGPIRRQTRRWRGRRERCPAPSPSSVQTESLAPGRIAPRKHPGFRVVVVDVPQGAT